jgi:hypothetical protein
MIGNKIPPARFERATSGLGNRCSILLSYGGISYGRIAGPTRTGKSIAIRTIQDKKISSVA